MAALTKSSSLSALGLDSGDHWVRFHVEGDLISFEVAASVRENENEERLQSKKPTGFVQKWGGSMRKIDDESDPWLNHINEKHLK